MRAMVIGSTRTAEELHRAFPDAPLKVAGGAHGPLEDEAVPEHGIVVATPGAEPAPPGRYSACLLLDADAMLGRAAFDADVEAVRRWRGAISLVRTAEEGGEVLVVGTSTLPAIRDLVAHRSALFLDRVLEDRRELDLPPFRRVAEVVGEREACRGFLETTEPPDGTEVLGPVDLEGPDQAGRSRAVARIEPRRSRELAAAARSGVAARGAPQGPRLPARPPRSAGRVLNDPLVFWITARRRDDALKGPPPWPRTPPRRPTTTPRTPPPIPGTAPRRRDARTSPRVSAPRPRPTGRRWCAASASPSAWSPRS
ncbi:hypothetical protein [Brachybacterium sp. GPGPB12]|uniref:hypothetical protein n=1 Tax=Brachybacterium sp. GPGPB12 TaxID=3023517 RepID=UPI00313436F4